MAVDGRRAYYQRLGDRSLVREPAAIVLERRKRFGRHSETRVAVEVRDVSMSGALLVLSNDVNVTIGQVVDLVLDGHRGAVKVRRLAPTGTATMCGVEFLDPHPDFLPSVHRWLGREAAVENARMR
jgi:PilZ domain